MDRTLTSEESLYFLENLVACELNRQGVSKFNPCYNRKRMETECLSYLYNTYGRNMSQAIYRNAGEMKVEVRNIIEIRKSVSTRRKILCYIIFWYTAASSASYLLIPLMSIDFFRAEVFVGLLVSGGLGLLAFGNLKDF